MLLEKILKQPAGAPGLHLRDAVYGPEGRVHLLREIMGLANAQAEGSRYIMFGVVRGEDGKFRFTGLGDGALAELQSYADVISRYIEPELQIEPFYGNVQGNLVAALEIKGCSNPPYVLKVDATADFDRGACWVREGGVFRPAQRADFDRMYRSNRNEKKATVANNVVQVGFDEDPAQTVLKVVMPDVSNPPSKLAAGRIKGKIDAKKQAEDINFEDTQISRLVHARLYGGEQDFEDQGINTLVQGYNAVADDHREEDDYYYFETNAVRLNLCLVNTGHEPLKDVSLLLTFPRAEQFRVAEYMYGPPGTNRSARESELMGYPGVKYYKSAVQVKQEFDLLEPDNVYSAFEQALRIAVTPELVGRKVRVRYSLRAKGLKEPEEGALTMLFRKPE